MEKISPTFISDLFLGRLEEREYKFSRKIYWHLSSLNFDLASVISDDNFLYDFKHNEAFFVFDHSCDPLSQDAFITLAKPLLEVFKTHKISSNRIIVLSPIPSKFFYKSYNDPNYISVSPSTLRKDKYFHIYYNSLWHNLHFDYLSKIGYQGSTASLAFSKIKKPKKHFLSLSRRDSLSRRFLNYLLHKEQLIDYGFISHQRLEENGFHKTQDEYLVEIKQLATRSDFETDKFLEYGYKKHFLEPTLKKSTSAYSLLFHQDLSSRVCFEIVSETDINDTLFMTEKTLKPILNKTPFLLNGSCLTLYQLKKLGFQSYDLLFDESYDREPIFYDRIMGMFENVKKFCSMPVGECHKKLEVVKEVCDYNFNHFLKHDWEFNLGKKLQRRIEEVLNV